MAPSAAVIDSNSSRLSYKLLKTWKAKDLKRYLKDHGLSCSGRKDDLIDRVCLAEGISRSGSDDRSVELEVKRVKILPANLTEEYNNLPRCEQLPGTWTKNLSGLSKDFSIQKIQEYLIYSTDKTCDGDSMRQYKTLKSYRMFTEGYVQNIETNSFGSFCFFRAQVMPSESTDRLYRVSLCTDKTTGDVYGGRCRCVAGLGEACSHLGALLFALEDFVSKGLNILPVDKTCTDVLCMWNKPSSLKVKPRPITEIDMRKIEYGKKITNRPKKNADSYDCRTASHRLVNKDDLQTLYQTMSKVNSSSCWVKFYDEDNILKQNDKVVSSSECGNTGTSSVEVEGEIEEQPSVSLQDENTKTYDDSFNLEGSEFREVCQKHFDGIGPLTTEEVSRIELKTRNQSESLEWMKQRKGRITASIVGEICKRRKTIPPDALLKRILQYGPQMTNKACQHGQQHESSARDVYVATMKAQGYDVSVEKRGLILNSEHPWFGASIDGIVIDKKGCELGIIEIKCPYVENEKMPGISTIEDLAKQRRGFCLSFSGNTLELDPKHNYFYQVQTQMGILGMKWCDFVVCLIAEGAKDVFIQRIYFDNEMFSGIFSQAFTFYKNAVIPEILTERVRRGKQLFPDSKTYIYRHNR
ncbi:uncharacterized protein [Ptychodera flava]|uniref:uncharacterized protein n=1 Tax=Ptychodera flava TaxID=63121 RepID=UPI00396A89F1